MGITLQDFVDCGWEALIDEADKRECSEYGRLLGKKAQELLDSGDNSTKTQALQLLCGIFSMFLDSDETDQPLKPAVVWGNTRSMILDDIKDDEFDVLLELAPTITEVEAKARICDVLWVAKRNHRMAMQAVEAYLASATRLERPRKVDSVF